MTDPEPPAGPPVITVDQARRRFGRDRADPVHHGHSNADVHRLTGPGLAPLWLKRAVGAAAQTVDGEAARLAWLSGTGIGCPELVGHGPGWIMTTQLPGRDVAQSWPAHHRADVLAAMVEQLRQLHSLDPAACPFASEFPAVEGNRRVVTHGDYCCPNVFVDPSTLEPTGVLDVGELGVGDPRVDLACLHVTLAGTLNTQFGGRPAYERTVRAYGADPEDPEITRLVEWYHSR